MKTPSIQIHDQTRRKTGDKYTVKYIGANGKPLAPTQGFNDVKAVKTHIAAMRKCVVTYSIDSSIYRKPNDHTKEQKFSKSGYANAAPKPKTKKA